MPIFPPPTASTCCPSPALPDRPGVDLTLHVWDFGGQQIYHTTHQFFMTRRSLYLLVWNARGDTDQGRLDHWLRKIQVLAPGSPVLLVATHCDERPPELNLDRFRAAYPQIVGMATVSNKTGAGIEELKATIAAEAAKLPLMEQEWPRAWVDVEEALQACDQPHINGQEFAAICAAAAWTRPRAADSGRLSARPGQDSLLPGRRRAERLRGAQAQLADPGHGPCAGRRRHPRPAPRRAGPRGLPPHLAGYDRRLYPSFCACWSVS